jgi:hypothetical protein
VPLFSYCFQRVKTRVHDFLGEACRISTRRSARFPPTHSPRRMLRVKILSRISFDTQSPNRARHASYLPPFYHRSRSQKGSVASSQAEQSSQAVTSIFSCGQKFNLLVLLRARKNINTPLHWSLCYTHPQGYQRSSKIST